MNSRNHFNPLAQSSHDQPPLQYDDREIAQTIGRFNQEDEQSSEIHHLRRAKYQICFQMIQSAVQKYHYLQQDLLKTNANWVESYQLNKTLHHHAKQRSHRAIDTLTKKTHNAYNKAMNVYQTSCDLRGEQAQCINHANELIISIKDFFQTFTTLSTESFTVYCQLNTLLIQCNELYCKIKTNQLNIDKLTAKTAVLFDQLDIVTKKFVSLEESIESLKTKINEVKQSISQNTLIGTNLNSEISSLQEIFVQDKLFMVFIGMCELLCGDPHQFFGQVDNTADQVGAYGRSIDIDNGNLTNYLLIFPSSSSLSSSSFLPLLCDTQLIKMYSSLSPYIDNKEKGQNLATPIPLLYLQQQLHIFLSSCSPSQITTLCIQLTQFLTASIGSYDNSIHSSMKIKKETLENQVKAMVATTQSSQEQIQQATQFQTHLDLISQTLSQYTPCLHQTIKTCQGIVHLREGLGSIQAVCHTIASLSLQYSSILTDISSMSSKSLNFLSDQPINVNLDLIYNQLSQIAEQTQELFNYSNILTQSQQQWEQNQSQYQDILAQTLSIERNKDDDNNSNETIKTNLIDRQNTISQSHATMVETIQLLTTQNQQLQQNFTHNQSRFIQNDTKCSQIPKTCNEVMNKTHFQLNNIPIHTISQKLARYQQQLSTDGVALAHENNRELAQVINAVSSIQLTNNNIEEVLQIYNTVLTLYKNKTTAFFATLTDSIHDLTNTIFSSESRKFAPSQSSLTSPNIIHLPEEDLELFFEGDNDVELDRVIAFLHQQRESVHHVIQQLQSISALSENALSVNSMK